MKNLKSKNVLITGASSGIGEAFAKQVAALGANLVIVARSENELQKLAKEIGEKHAVNCQVIALDLSSQNAAQELFEKTKSAGIEVDILINNAGFGRFGYFEENDFSIYDSMLKLNVQTLTELCWLYLPGMKKKNYGGIINVASIGALLPVPFSSVYAATKSYVLNFSESLYGELLETDVTVTCLCPGRTKTNFARTANSPLENYESRPYDTAENSAILAIRAFREGRNMIITGPQKLSVQILPKFLSRSRIIKITAKIYKK